MSLASLLPQRCTVQRQTKGDAQDGGQQAIDWTTDTDTNVPCRKSSPEAATREVTEQIAAAADFVIFLMPTQSIAENNRIVLENDTYEILLVQNPQSQVGAHHKKVWARVVRSS